MHLFLSYCKSHIYELHAILAGTISFLLMFIVKKPIKEEINRFVEKKAASSAHWNKKRVTYRRRMGIILITLDFLLSGAVFGIVSVISPMIHFSVPTMWFSGVMSTVEYAVYDQITFGRKKDSNE